MTLFCSGQNKEWLENFGPRFKRVCSLFQFSAVICRRFLLRCAILLIFPADVWKWSFLAESRGWYAVPVFLDGSCSRPRLQSGHFGGTLDVLHPCQQVKLLAGKGQEEHLVSF